MALDPLLGSLLWSWAVPNMVPVRLSQESTVSSDLLLLLSIISNAEKSVK